MIHRPQAIRIQAAHVDRIAVAVRRAVLRAARALIQTAIVQTTLKRNARRF